jgi:O-antigen ligase
LKRVIFGAAIVTLVATPWISSDALIIPKIISLACLASFLIPTLIINYKTFLTDRKIKLLLFLCVIYIIQMVIVMFISKAPFEQEFFGRTGRGLGFITYFSLVVIMLYTAININLSNMPKIFQGLLFSCLLSSIYSIFQFFGVDFSDWRTQTNGIIGTIGNPNFQSSFIAISFVPTMVYLWPRKNRLFLILGAVFVLLFTLYICESTQGYIALASSLAVFILLKLWFNKSKLFFAATLIPTILIGFVAIAGMLDKGPLSYYLYKVSVRSRGEMWQTAISVIKSNPVFGVGLDSLGDYSLMYQNEKTANGIAEFIDNSHNFFLQFAATGGIILALCYIGIILLSLYSFFVLQKRIGKFDRNIAALFAAWISFQLQSLISPAVIPTLIWNFIFCGTFIGLSNSLNLKTDLSQERSSATKKIVAKKSMNGAGIIAAVLAFVLTFPLFNADKLTRQADRKKDALLAVKAAKTYPESVIRYNLLGAGLYESGLYDLSLEIARSAVKFNPNSYQTWILILVNPRATNEERYKAKEQLMKIDPFNKNIQNYQF